MAPEPASAELREVPAGQLRFAPDSALEQLTDPAAIAAQVTPAIAETAEAGRGRDRLHRRRRILDGPQSTSLDDLETLREPGDFSIQAPLLILDSVALSFP